MTFWTTKKILTAGIVLLVIQIILPYITKDTWGTYYITHTIKQTGGIMF